MMKQWKSLIVFFVLVAGVALIGGMSTPDAWYAGLQKPSFNPPNWIFAPVWTVLYVLIAVAAWRIWKQAGGWCAALWWARC